MKGKEIEFEKRNLQRTAENTDQTSFTRLFLWAICTIGLCNVVPVCLSQFYLRIPSSTILWFPEKLYSPGANVPVFYQNAGFEGWYLIGWSEYNCVDLPVEAHGVSSVNNRGNCILLYDKPHCEGKSVTLYPDPEGKSYNDLSLLAFDDVTRSIGPCYPNRSSRPD